MIPSDEEVFLDHSRADDGVSITQGIGFIMDTWLNAAPIPFITTLRASNRITMLLDGGGTVEVEVFPFTWEGRAVIAEEVSISVFTSGVDITSSLAILTRARTVKLRGGRILIPAHILRGTARYDIASSVADEIAWQHDWEPGVVKAVLRQKKDAA